MPCLLGKLGSPEGVVVECIVMHCRIDAAVVLPIAVCVPRHSEPFNANPACRRPLPYRALSVARPKRLDFSDEYLVDDSHAPIIHVHVSSTKRRSPFRACPSTGIARAHCHSPSLWRSGSSLRPAAAVEGRAPSGFRPGVLSRGRPTALLAPPGPLRALRVPHASLAEANRAGALS